MFSITPNQIAEKIQRCVDVAHGDPIVPVFKGPPGVGKSAGVLAFAKRYNLKVIDVRLTTCSPEDLTGLPMRVEDASGNTKATFAPFDMFPLEGDELPEGYQGWILFLDELTSAGKQMQAAGYKLILDRMIGNRHLHPAVICVAAGNRMEDKAVVQQMSTALQSRLIHYNIELDNRQTLIHFRRSGFDHRIISYLEMAQSMMHRFNPDHDDQTFPCPRTWDFLSRMIKGNDIDESWGADVAGTIGQGAAVEFIQFAQEFDKLPKLKDILEDPENFPIPRELSTKYATMSMLTESIIEENAEDILKFVDRFPSELKIVFARGAYIQKMDILEYCVAFDKFRVRVSDYLSDIAA